MMGAPTVTLAIIVKTMIVTIDSAVSSPDPLMMMPADAAKIRFLGLTPVSKAPKPSVLAGGIELIAFIQFGILAGSSDFGRPRNCLTANAIKMAPSKSLMTP